MLSKLFRSRARFDDADPAARHDAVVGLTHDEVEQFQTDLAELARQDENQEVRLAAISRLNDLATLRSLLDDPTVADPAAERLASFGKDDPGLLEEPAINRAAIRIARNPDEVADRIEAVTDDTELLALAIASRTPKVRLAVAERLKSEALLTELEHQSRDRDKNVNRLARSAIDDIRHARQAREKALHRARDLVTQLTTLRDSDTTLAARLGVARQDWQLNVARMDEANAQLNEYGIEPLELDSLSAEFEGHLSRLEATVANRPSEPAPTRRTFPGRGPDALFTPILEQIESLLQSVSTGQRDVITEQATIHEAYSTIQEHWLAEADHTPPPENIADAFHRLTHTFAGLFQAAEKAVQRAASLEAAMSTSVTQEKPANPDEFQALWRSQRQARRRFEEINRVLREIGWPDDVRPPAALQAARDHCQALTAFDSFCHELHDELKAALTDNLRRLEQDVVDGHLNSAIGDETDVKQLLKSLPDGSARKLEQEFHALDARVQELKDWRTYATGPKREELCEAVEALAAAPLAPPEQAERIKALREEWKSLGTVTSHADRKLLDRFNAAAETAFKPCREYFEAQSAERKFNLEQRRTICDDLEGYLDNTDWETYSDWKAAERILRAARDEWRKFHPVDRSPGRKVQARFEALTDRLHALIKVQWDANVAAKQAIVAEAEAIRDSAEDLRQTTEQIKTLQRRWKAVGVTPRRVDQRLWRAFRAVCDEVFGQREQVRVQRRESIDAHIREATGICEAFEEALRHATADSATTKELTGFVHRFNDVPELPHETRRTLDQRFRDTEKNYRALLREGERRATIRTLDALQHADLALCAVESELATGASPAIPADLPSAFNARIEALAEALTATTDLNPAMAENLHARHQLAIEMEIVAAMDTPAEDQQRRLELQVERLNQGLRQREEIADDPLQLAERFCATGPAGADHPEIGERFFRACRAACE